MKLGISTYAYMWAIGFEGARPSCPMTHRDLLVEARRLGVSLIQFGPNLSVEVLSSHERIEFAAAARVMGIDLELGTKGLEPSYIRAATQTACECGATLLRTTVEHIPSSVDQLAQSISLLLPILQDSGVTLAIENSRVPAQVLAGAMESLNSSSVGITLDTVNSLAISEGIGHVLSRLTPFVRCLHLKDYTVCREWHGMGFRVEGRPAGDGHLNVPQLLGVLSGAKHNFNVILELWPPAQPALQDTIALEKQWAAQSIEYLRQWVKE